MAKKKSREKQEARTMEEILDELRNSALATPIVIVEGPEDVLIYREIARRRLSASQIAFDFVGVVKKDGQRDGGSRSTLIALSKRVKTELPGLKRPILFFADRDLEVFTGLKPEWEGIYFTHGYAIENDLFADGQPHQNLYFDEQPIWETRLDHLCNWFAGQVHIGLAGQRDQMKIALNLRDPHNWEVVEKAPPCPDPALLAQVRADYVKLTRGKHLLDLLFSLHQARTGEQLLNHPPGYFLQGCINQGLTNRDSHTYRLGQIIWASAGYNGD
ncbi:MAG: DUF4435 domain-containing protein [Bernardetiaceae bacterium]|jgi:hypothetical protein|nr:DUF4435 domain-containing protein [Bernardetiaceae bacterium]